MLVLASLVAGLLLKIVCRWRIDGAPGRHTIELALGLTTLGPVRPLDPPHTRPNFVMREMGYSVARKHAEKLRRCVLLAIFAVPILLVFANLITGWTAAYFGLAILAAALGVFIERPSPFDRLQLLS